MSEQNLQSHEEVKKLALAWGSALLNYDFGPEHPFGSARAGMTISLMEEVGLLARPDIITLPVSYASRDDLLLFHTRELLDFVQNACVRGYGFLDGGDTPAFEGLYEAAVSVVGGSLKGVEVVMKGETGYAVMAGGVLRHGHPGRASGVLVFMDMVICMNRYLMY